MSFKQPGLLYALLLCLVTGIWAQAPADKRAQQEKEAEVLYQQGDAKMKIFEYDDAIAAFRIVLKRFPDTDMRYQSQFRIADALMAQKKPDDAIDLLKSIVKEESQQWSPKALMRIGDIYAGAQKYTESFNAYRQVIKDYPDNPLVDHAYFAIGAVHYDLGHFEQAAKELDKVGTVYASTIDKLQRVAPGEPLYVRLTEPNLVAAPDTHIPVTLSAKSGDKESVTLSAEVEGGETFGATLPTALGDAKPNDGVLQLHGNDTVTMEYKSRYVGTGAQIRRLPMTVASNGHVLVRDSAGNEVKGVVVGDKMSVEVNDPDMDKTDGPDTLTVDVKTRKKDAETLTLTETDRHTGIFRTIVPIVHDTPKVNSGSIETNAGFSEASSVQYDDGITVSYLDEMNLAVGATDAVKVTTAVNIYAAAVAELTVAGREIEDPSKEIKAFLYKGRSLTQIAATYRDLGQSAVGTINFRKATEQFRQMMAKYPNAPEVEDAMYGLFQNYVEQGLYDAAIGMVNQITRRFPQSNRASEAMLELAQLHVRREEFDRALAIYTTLANTAKGTPLAEQAKYSICTTYVLMFKPKAASGGERPVVTREQVTSSLEDFVRSYPASERAPDAYWQLVQFRYDSGDFRGAVDTARRMVTTYPDNVLAGRVLLIMGRAQYKQRDIDGAKETFRRIIVDYGSEADAARKDLTEIEAKFKTNTTPAGAAAAGQ